VRQPDSWRACSALVATGPARRPALGRPPAGDAIHTRGHAMDSVNEIWFESAGTKLFAVERPGQPII
jgi:hypothetical protein